MSKYIDNLYEAHNNIFIFTPLIIKFYKDLQPIPKNILLSYLVLPMVLHEDSKNNLKNAKTTSSIHTYMNKNDNLFGLPNRVQNYKKITNNCLQYALAQNWIKINDDLSITVTQEQDNKIENLNISFRASSNLYKIFGELGVVEIYKLLGMKKL